jgi:hypothetical protein
MISAYIFLSAYKREKGGMHCRTFILHALLTFSAPRYGTSACRTNRRIGSASVRRRRIAKSFIYLVHAFWRKYITEHGSCTLGRPYF